MNGLINTLYIYLLFLISITIVTFVVIKIRDNSQLFMPEEYKIIKRIVNKLSANNDLGEYPLTFTVIAGTRATWIANSLGLSSKNQSCFFLKHINPFVPYKGKLSAELNEAVRQSYLLDSVEAAAFPNGYIEISRSSFRNNENLEDYLAFVIGHEISHVLNEDSFNDSLKIHTEGKKLKTKKKMNLGFKISRQSEINADINSSKMLINAGYSKNTPMKAYDFFSKKTGYGYVTEKNSTHPGFEDRSKNLFDNIEKYTEAEISINSKAYTKGSWIYDRKENTLTYKVKERYLPPELKNLKAATNLAKRFKGDVID